MVNQVSVVFCGSFVDFSAQVLQELLKHDHINVSGVVTTPPLIDKKGAPLHNPVHSVALQAGLLVFTPTTLDQNSLTQLKAAVGQPQLLLTAGYGKLLPQTWLDFASVAALNLHFSLLPAYRGANPGEWALLRGETTSGTTLIEMSPQFDTGHLVAQQSSKIAANETRLSLYHKLYGEGAKMVAEILPSYVEAKTHGKTLRHPQYQTFWPPAAQPDSPTPYAQRFKRNDGKVEWEGIQELMVQGSTKIDFFSDLLQQVYASISTQPSVLDFFERTTRALAEFPSVWSSVETSKGPRRLKIIEVKIEDNRLVLHKVQLAGQQVAFWNQVKNTVSINLRK